jgi:hypothetical protein
MELSREQVIEAFAEIVGLPADELFGNSLSANCIMKVPAYRGDIERFAAAIAAPLQARIRELEQDVAAISRLTKDQRFKGYHVAYSEDGVLHWMSGRKFNNCELYVLPKGVERDAVDAARWIPVSERLPQAIKAVLAVRVMSGRAYVIRAYYAPRFTIEAQCDDEATEYREEDDTEYLNEGWYEFSEEADVHYGVTGVTHWMPLPAAPIDAARGASHG